MFDSLNMWRQKIIKTEDQKGLVRSYTPTFDLSHFNPSEVFREELDQEKFMINC